MLANLDHLSSIGGCDGSGDGPVPVVTTLNGNDDADPRRAAHRTDAIVDPDHRQKSNMEKEVEVILIKICIFG